MLRILFCGLVAVLFLATPGRGPLAAGTAATGQEAAPSVRLRVGRHTSFSRMVFDWPGRVGYELEQTQGRAILHFDQQARLDATGYHANPPRGIEGLEPAHGERGLPVAMRIPKDARLRAFRNGKSIVLDVLDFDAPADAQPDGAAPSKTAKAPAKAPPKMAKAPAESQSRPPSGERQANVGSPPSKDMAAPVVEGVDAVADQTTAETELADQAPQPQDSQANLVSAHSSPPPREPIPTPGPAAPRGEPVTLSFEFAEPSAAAAFRRGNRLWLVFDQVAPEGLAARIAKAAPALEPVERLPASDATVLRMAAPPVLMPRLRRDESGWQVDLRARGTAPESEVKVKVLAKDRGARVQFRAKQPGRVVGVVDPDLGEQLYVVPVRNAGQGLAEPREFPEFRALATYQGVAIQPFADGLRVSSTERGILVHGGGLLVSTDSLRQRAERDAQARRRGAKDLGRRLFDLVAWRRGGPEDFARNKQALQLAVVRAEGANEGVARHDLVRFFFAHGLAREALSVLRLMGQENERLAYDPEALLLRAASEFLIEDYAKAAETLTHEALSDEWEVMLWQAALAAVAQDWAFAAERFADSEPLFDAYARPVRNRLRLLAAESLLGIGDSGGASLILHRVRVEAPSDGEQAQIDYLEGRRLELADNLVAAEEQWRLVAVGTHRPTQARARLALVDQGLRQGTLDSTAAIDELERLRFAWRGDEFEFALLRRLGDLHADRGAHRDALLAMRQAASYFPQSERAKEVAEKMRELFADVMMGEAGRDWPPLRVLALYEEFKELTPVGEAGDRLIAGLADRLVEVDLLAQAADLLESQIEFRLRGAQKSRSGARLALIRLLDRAPDKALAALETSAVTEPLSEVLLRQRRHLRARALSELGREGDASALLAGDDSEDALRLQADILWSQRDWAGVAGVLRRLVPDPVPRDRALDDAEAQAVVNLAVAYTLAGRRTDLRGLGERYAGAVEPGPQREALAMLTGDLDAAAMSGVANELAAVDQIQAFMSSYRAGPSGAGGAPVN